MIEAEAPLPFRTPAGGPGANLARGAVALALLLVLYGPAVAAQAPPSSPEPAPAGHSSKFPPVQEGEPDLHSQLEPFQHALFRLPLAGALGAILAFRPRRRGTPERTTAVVQTQIILALVGAMVMLVVGSSVARAFGIVGAASLVRYRAKIDDPKDAGIMLATLGIGLASGVGLYLLAPFATLFIMGVVWLLESQEPEGQRLFSLKVKTKEAAELRPKVESILRRNRLAHDLRSSSTDEVVYEVKVPLRHRTERLSNAILGLAPDGGVEVEWGDKKEAKAR